jgi:hypothetical protein
MNNKKAAEVLVDTLVAAIIFRRPARKTISVFPATPVKRTAERKLHLWSLEEIVGLLP